MLIINKKMFLIFSLTVIITLLFAGVIFIFGEAAENDMPIKIIVDAGHGAPDGGAVGTNGTLEKDVNLNIAIKLAEVLDAKGYIPIMTRTGDNGIYDSSCTTIREMKRDDMNKRLNIMKNSGASLFVSIHMNAFQNKSAKGLHIFYSKNHEKIKPLAENIQVRISEITGAKTHTVTTADENLFLMKNPPVPAILAECGFLSNEEEEKNLNDSNYQSKLAWAIAEAIDSYYNIKTAK